MLAARAPQNAVILVEEGTAEVGAKGAKAVTVPAGQSLRLEGGQPGPLTQFAKSEGMQPTLIATPGHGQTPQEGLDHLVSLQVAQATALGTAIVGAEDTEVQGTGNKDETKNAIIGTTGGVNNSVISQLFPASGFGQGNPNQTGNRTAQTTNSSTLVGETGDADVGNIVTSTNINVSANANGLLVFTRNDGLVRAEKCTRHSNP
jgi:hypothetical protein